MSTQRLAACACLCILSLASGAIAQRVPVGSLTIPLAKSAEGFTNLVAIRELADGRILIVDQNDRLIRILSPQLSVVATLARRGSGPGEYLLPNRIFHLPGDSFAVNDMGNGRMLVIHSNGSLGGFLDQHGVWSGSKSPGSIKHIPSRSDGRGYFYAKLLPSVTAQRGRNVRLAASSPIIRWQAGSLAPDTIASVEVADNLRSGSKLGTMISTRPLVPFEPYPQWDVASDGSIGIVYPEPYHVEVFAPNGTRTTGPPIKVDRIPVTESDKEKWRESAGTVVGFRSTGDGGREVGTFKIPVREPSEWRRFMPPFLNDAVHYAPDGRLWVQRAVNTGKPGLLELFDSLGRLLQRFAIAPNRRLLGFGRDVVYVVYRDDVDLEYVERYALPR